MRAAARKATMSALAITQLMASCQAVQAQLFFFLYMPTARRPSSRKIVHMCEQDSFPFYKVHILWVWVLPLSRKNLSFETLHWRRML